MKRRWRCGVMLMALVLAPVLLACPEETVTYPPLAVRQFAGRIESRTEDGLLPTKVHFLVRKQGDERFEREVPLQVDGTFVLGLADGAYEYQIQAEGFLFTVVGTVRVTAEGEEGKTIALALPWC